MGATVGALVGAVVGAGVVVASGVAVAAGGAVGAAVAAVAAGVFVGAAAVGTLMRTVANGDIDLAALALGEAASHCRERESIGRGPRRGEELTLVVSLEGVCSVIRPVSARTVPLRGTAFMPRA